MRPSRRQGITFARSRAYWKNASCFVERKNYLVVRSAMEYWRYAAAGELAVLNELYDWLRLYTSFFR